MAIHDVDKDAEISEELKRLRAGVRRVQFLSESITKDAMALDEHITAVRRLIRRLQAEGPREKR